MITSPLHRRWHRGAPWLLLLALFAQAAPGAQQLSFLDLTSSVPDAWQVEQPSSSMRVLQLRVPGAEGAEEVQLVVYYFGPGQGGTVEANVARWKSQFSGPDGGPVEPEITRLDQAALPATLVALEGSYARTVGMGAGAEAKPDRMLLAAIVEGPQGNLYAQLHGPAAQVAAARGDFVAFVEGITPSQPAQ
jgi:hypothetical protein